VLTVHSNRAATGSSSSQPAARLSFFRYLLGRLVLFAFLLGLDILLLASTPHSAQLLTAVAPIGIVTYAVFIALGYSHLKRQRQQLPFRASFFLIHLACILLVSFTNLAAIHGFALPLPGWSARITSSLVVLAGISLLALACIPLRAWAGTIRITRRLWMYSLLAGIVAWCLRFPFQSMWDSASSASGRILQVIAFNSVHSVLRVFLPDIYVNAATFVIGTPRFQIIVAEGCSGLEGLGLVLAFTIIWLIYFRGENRYPQALLLIPCALLSVWMLNILRISALVLIGNAGYGEIAMVGFHSQAGWIAFTTVAFAFSMATRKLPWVRKVQYTYMPLVEDAALPRESRVDSSQNLRTRHSNSIHLVTLNDESEETGESQATAAYLVPFLAILGASFLSKAASGHFEWLYPLRFLAASVAIWHYWPQLKQIDWRPSRAGWTVAALTGFAVCAIWLAPSLWNHQQPSSLGAALASLSPSARWAWIAFRIAAAVITVPIAEELAFRGFLARRLVIRNFDSLPFSAATMLSIGLSSVAFGLLHGQQWMVGILAGLAYAGVMKFRGRLSDAILAHAATNLLLAVWVLFRGDWAQW
jgi:CAAX prenyl protease-like protein